MVRSIRASWPGGVSLASRAAAPPVSFMVGRPDGRLTTPMSRHHTPGAHAGAERLGAGFLGGEALRIGLDALGAPLGARAFGVGEDAREKALAVPLDHLLDAADVGDVGADAR